ncbi:MAG: hypothetical protein KDA57_07355 [Planctomycetales bacterium]|nr:hypothetical protein [Planctomycetales bacterium]
MAIALAWHAPIRAEDTSAPAMLQIFEAKWQTIEDRQVDLFYAGYGSMWLPPPQKGDTGGFSVGYDVFDRFDLGTPSSQTLYGTEAGLKGLTSSAHRASVDVYTDFIGNHNGFGDSLDASFAALGGYPGFALTVPGDPFGDFHDPSIDFNSDPFNGQLAGLVDIAHEKRGASYQFIRHPVAAGNPDNIPAGTTYNLPDPNNARFYPDQGLGGLTVTDLEQGTSVTLYDFNSSNPLLGDPVLENALDLLKRNARWMIQEIGVDGFRLDAVRHMDEDVLDELDQAVFRANPRLQHDGSIKPVYSFSEVFDGNKGAVQGYIRRDLPNAEAISSLNTTVGGNRDALDFPLFFAMRDNLTGTTGNNNWHGIRNASQDTQDDGLRNGSQGVAWVQSHDDVPGGTPFLKNVGYAYTLMRPGEALVYFNAKEFGEGRPFPQDGKVDALGGIYGDTITTLVNIRNTHGRGDFHERWIDDAFNPNGFSSIYVYERSKSAVVGLSGRTDPVVETRSGVQTNFDSGTILVELTGNAADAIVDPGGVIPETVKVNGSGQINISIPSNSTHGRGYVIYGLPTPQGTLSLTNVASVLAGAAPSAATNGTARLGDIDVIQADSFEVQLNTTPVSVIDPDTLLSVRDYHADGDTALIRIDEGMDLNTVSGIDNASPGGVAYGFEDFTDTRAPGYIYSGGANVGTGSGTYAQTIDATQLSEGRHFITVRAFRHRNAGTGGDGGEAVFTDFKRVVYVDRFAPESEVVSFDPYGSSADDLDLVIGSVDQTANEVHVMMNLGAAKTESEILAMVNAGNKAATVGGGQFKFGVNNVVIGNHAATVVMMEPTGRYTVRRFVGLSPDTGFGGGFGDTDQNGFIGPADMLGFETVLYSQNNTFNATSDTNADGLVDNRDLFQLGTELLNNGASQFALDKYLEVLTRRGDLNSDSSTNGLDVVELYNGFGIPDTNPDFWSLDLNVDGQVDINDVSTLITEIARSVPGDFDLDGDVDAFDLLTLQQGMGATSGALYIGGDASLDGVVDQADYQIWQDNFGFVTSPLVAPLVAGAAAIPEPTTGALAMIALMALTTGKCSYRSRRRDEYRY